MYIYRIAYTTYRSIYIYKMFPIVKLCENFFLLWNVYGAARSKPLTQCTQRTVAACPLWAGRNLNAPIYRGVGGIQWSFSYSCSCSLFISLSICFRPIRSQLISLCCRMKFNLQIWKYQRLLLRGGRGGYLPWRLGGFVCTTVSTWNFRLGCCLFI